MDQFTQAAYNLLAPSVDEMRAAVTGLSVADLNRTPCADANPLAVLVAHSVSSTRALIDAAITGRRNRQRYYDEERVPAFATTDASADTLLTLLDDLQAAIARLQREAPADGYAGDVIDESGAAGPTMSRAQSLVQAAAHLREHVGHAQLTRQLIDAGLLASA